MLFFNANSKSVAVIALAFSAMGSAIAGVTIDVTPIQAFYPRIDSVSVYAQAPNHTTLVSNCLTLPGSGHVEFRNLPFKNGQTFYVGGYRNSNCKGTFPATQVTAKYGPTTKYIILR